MTMGFQVVVRNGKCVLGHLLHNHISLTPWLSGTVPTLTAEGEEHHLYCGYREYIKISFLYTFVAALRIKTFALQR